MGTTAEKLTYLNTTKQLIKESINLTDANITTQPFRQYATILKHRLPEIVGDPSIIWNNYEHVTGSGTSFSITAYNSIIDYSLKGNTTQNGTPTPTSPIPINVVSGDNEINVCGKNVLNLNNFTTTTLSGITLTPNFVNGKLVSISTSGTYSSTTYIALTSAHKIQPNKQYTLSGAFNPSARLRLREYDSSNTQLSEYFDQGSGVSFTSKSNADHINVQVVFYASNPNAIFYPQLEVGNTKTTYEPYIGNTYPIYLGVENLLEPKMATTTQRGITCTNNGDGSFTLNGTATGGTATGGIAFRLDQSTYNGNDNLKNYNGTYTLSCNELINGMQLIVMQNQTWNFLVRMLNSNTPKTFTADKDNCFIYVYVESGITLNNLVIKPQLEKGSKANSFSPYGTAPIELCKIGDYQDSIIKDNGKWYLHKEIGKVVLDGSETWQVGSSATNRSVFSNPTTFADRKNTSSYSDFYCDNFSYLGNAQGEVLGYAMSFNSGQYARFIYVQVPLAVVAQGQIDDFKNWLSIHKATVYYILETPTNTEITDVNLIYQLNGVSLITGLNNISVSGDLPATLDLTALKYE